MSTRKQCRCCKRMHGPESWSKLPLIGYMANGNDSAGEVLELRHCPCKTTLALDYGDEPDSIAPHSVPPLSAP